MKNNLIITISISLIALIILVLILSNTKKEIREESFETEILVENLDTVWAMDFLPSGDLIFTERFGRVSIFDFNTKKVKIVGNIDVSEVSESGLAGIAVNPDFNENKFIYVYYTNSNRHNRVSRFVLENDKLKNEVILLDNIPSAQFHDGGRLKFGPDKKLYITTGDATNPSSAQDINSLAGKILRMNKDGSIPEDTPFGNYVYSYGHRNPQGIAWNNKMMYSSEHGPTRNDEINLIIKGKNYGWPIECSEQLNTSIPPIRCYTEFTLAPSGIAFHKGDLYIAGLKGTQLRKISFDNSGNIIKEETLFEDLGRIREVVSHENYLYIGTSNKDGRGFPRNGDDKILRVKIE